MPAITLEITKPQIQALLQIAPKNDIRYYLNGVCIDADRGLLVATDGSAMLILRAQIDGTGRVIARRETLEQVSKAFGKTKTATIEIEGDSLAAHVNGSRIGADLIEAEYPDYIKATPSTTNGTIAQFGTEYLASLGKAFTLLGANKRIPIEIAHNGLSAALVGSAHVPDALGVLMPCRPNNPDLTAIRADLLGSPIAETNSENESEAEAAA